MNEQMRKSSEPLPNQGEVKSRRSLTFCSRNRILALLLVLMFVVCSLPASAFAAISTGNSKFDAFISEPEFAAGAAWDWDKRPTLVSSGNFGCAAYCTDFIKYCYDQTNLIGREYTDINEIRAGDVVSLGNPSDGTGHWFVVLNRDGNKLLVAEGNYDHSVRIGWNYTISGDRMAEDNRFFRAGYHYVDELPGAVQGWVKTEGGWKYVLDTGSYAVNAWIKTSGKWYSVGADGYMITGWSKINGKWYYFAGSGVMVTGWKKIGGTWYYFLGGGAMATGWKKIGGSWYYFAGGGAMQNGWGKIGGKWYYFAGGVMTTGWKCVDGKWYYFADSGIMQTGWKQIDGKKYYLTANGMVTGKKTIGGVTYVFAKNGALVE